MKINKFYLIACLFLLFFTISCSSNEKCTDCELEKENDSIQKKDSVSTLESELKAETLIPESKEQAENLKKIEKKFGEQWDFCSCVIANDSINTAFEKNVSDKEADVLMKRWEFVEIKCKAFLTQPNSTPEERAIHEKKVKKCLKSKKK
jgi:hypothetical protein